MSLIIRFFTWPRTSPDTPWNKWRFAYPWWLMLWKAFWVPFIIVSAGLFVVLIFVAHGPEKAGNAWEAIR